MGGTEATRGFLCQTFVAVLEALCSDNWEKIFAEYASDDDKVDIALESNGKVFKSIQVKSSINLFSASKIQKWLTELINDNVGATEFEVFLIGACDGQANSFINSIKKFQKGQSDNVSKKALVGFDTNLIQGKKVLIECLPLNIPYLESIVRDTFNRYLYYKNIQYISYETINMITASSAYDQFVSSTNGQGITRKDFEEKLIRQIDLFIKQMPPRRSIGIKSFSPHSDYLETKNYDVLSFLDKFDNRALKEKYDWNKDIYAEMCSFLNTKTHMKEKYQIFLETHSSIAFAAGKMLGSKSGVDIYPFQKTPDNGLVLWDQHSFNTKYSNWEIEITTIDARKTDVALVLGVARDIESAVKEYISDANLPIGRLINCRLEGEAATNYSIRNGDHAAFLSNTIYDVLKCRTLQERRGVMHIFSAAPNALMFYIGKNSLGFGKHILYEYDFEQRDTCTYSPSISFIS